MGFQSVCIVLCFLGSIALLRGQGFKPAGQISDQCFKCLCEAASECDETSECFSKGPGQYHCGPYHISFEYWKDAEKPGENPDDPLDFEKCLNNKSCAEAAIRGYMQKWARDCDGNDKINCFDYARIHKSGAYACNDSYILNTDFWSRFENCYEEE